MLRYAAPFIFALAATSAASAKEAPDPKPGPAPNSSGATVHNSSFATPLTTPAAAYSVSYEYDSLGRLITATKDTHSSAFTYDAAGNRTASSEH